MTRVEKYHRYREEIANMKTENNSDKKITSQLIEEMRKNSSSSRLTYDEVMDVYNIDSKKLNHISFHLKSYQILYIIIGLLLISALIALCLIK